MALVLANRVQETGTANTTVSFSLAGPVQGFQSFSAVGNGNTTYYSATDGAGNWEVGLGTYSTTGPTLTRTTVYASSNAGNAVTFSGAVNVFVTYPSGRSVNLNESGNVSALGTVSSGVWQGSTVGVAYGGTGVTSSSGANSVVLRDANENITVNRLNQGLQTITASGGTTILTAASDFNQQLVGTGGHTFRLPDATTLTDTTTFQFNNNATGTLTIQNNAATTVGTVAPGGAAGIALMSNATSGGTWDVHGYIPENVTWGTNALAFGSTVITGGTWQGGTITPAYGGTGLTSFTTNGAVYATGTTTLTSGTLPVISGGTGTTSVPTNGQLLIGNGSTYTVASLGTTTGISTTVGSGTLTINNTGVTSLAGTSPVTASASTGSVTMSLASGYGDTQNPYASKTANFFLAAPNGSAGAPTFRAVVAADIPTLNQNTTGSAGSVVNAVTFNNGGTGDVSGTTFNGSAARTISYNTIGAPSTTGTNATGTWGISISGNAATATTAANVNNGTLSMGVSGTGLSGSASFTANQSGNSTFTVTSNATNANTGSTIVARDASGNFSAGTITATLSGSATSAGSVSNSVTFNNGGAGGASGSTFNGSGALTVSYNTVGAPSTTGTNASGTWGINISGNAATATSATTATTAGASTYLITQDIRTLSPSSTAAYRLGFGFTSWANNNTSPYADYLALRSYSDSSGGNDNLLVFNKSSIAMRLYQQTFGSASAYSSFADVLMSNNYNSYAPTLTGGGASGTWGINVTGSAQSANSLQSGAVSTGPAYFRKNQTDGNYTTAALWTESYGNTTTGIAFHISGVVGKFLEMRTNGTLYWNSDILLNSANYNSYALPLSGGTMSGGLLINSGTTNQLQLNTSTGTQGLWVRAGYDADGTATPVVSPLNIQFQSSGSSGGTFSFVSGNSRVLAIGSGAVNSLVALQQSGNQVLHAGNYTSYAPTLTGSGASGTWGINISGNAATATSATSATNATNVAGLVQNSFTTYGNTATTTAKNSYYGLLLGNTTSHLNLMADGGGNGGIYREAWGWPMYWSAGNSCMGFGASATTSGYVVQANGSLYATGSILASGNVTAYSDERLKTNWRDLPQDFVAQLAKVKVGVYDRTDEGNLTQVGVSAQSLQAVMPEAVTTGPDDMLSVSYGNAALAAAVKLAERVVEQEARINRLEALIEKLIGGQK